MDEGSSEGGSETATRRRLAAILAADAEGYSRLMALDDQGTVAALDAARAQFRAQAGAHDGRVVDTAGDSVLAVFQTASGAVAAALEVQRALHALAAAQPADRVLRFRIGVHLGDVIEKADGSVYGDGVNVAARLQALASPGGVSVSDAVRAAVGQRVAVQYDDASAQAVKNIAEPVRVFHLRVPSQRAPGRAGSTTGLGFARRTLRWGMTAALVLVGGSIAAVLIRQQGVAREAGAITMSVALGPIAASGDATDAGEGPRLSRALATGISAYVGHVRVIAVPGTTSDGTAFREAARKAGARYAMEGDLQPAGPQRQLSLRLVDASSGRQVWSGSFDWPGPGAEAVAMQVSTRAAVGVLAYAVGAAEVKRVLAKPVSQLEPMEQVVRAYGVLGQGPSLAHAREAVDLLASARRQDPTLVPALLMMGDALEMLHDTDPELDLARYTRETDEVSQRAVALEPDWPVAWHGRSSALMRLRRWDAAIEASNRFMRLDRYNPRAFVQHAAVLVALGRPVDALPFTERAMTMSGGLGGNGQALVVACHAHLLLGASDKAATSCEKARTSDDVFTQTLLVAAYANSGDAVQARTALADLQKIVPALTVSMARAKDVSDHPAYVELAEPTLYAGLRKAGLKD